LLFKLMFMSGVVKVTANCETWLGLTALDYHFATQCLPTPLAWFAHQMHPLLLQVGVAVTFVVEIPVPFLVLVRSDLFLREPSPLREIRFPPPLPPPPTHHWFPS
jgi:hypothetical protein